MAPTAPSSVMEGRGLGSASLPGVAGSFRSRAPTQPHRSPLPPSTGLWDWLLGWPQENLNLGPNNRLWSRRQSWAVAPHSRKLGVELGESNRNKRGTDYTGGSEGGFRQEAEVPGMQAGTCPHLTSAIPEALLVLKPLIPFHLQESQSLGQRSSNPTRPIPTATSSVGMSLNRQSHLGLE